MFKTIGDTTENYIAPDGKYTPMSGVVGEIACISEEYAVSGVVDAFDKYRVIPVKEFYKKSKVMGVVKNLKLEKQTRRHPKTNKITEVDPNIIRQAILKHPDIFKDFLDDIARDNGQLYEIRHHANPKKGSKEYDDLLACIKLTDTRTREDGRVFYKYEPKPKCNPAPIVNKLPQYSTYDLVYGDKNPDPIASYDRLLDLAKRLELPLDDNPQIYPKNELPNFVYDQATRETINRVIEQAVFTHSLLDDFITIVFANLKEQYDLLNARKQTRLWASLKDGHEGLPKPTTTSLVKLFEDSEVDPARLARVYDDYRTPEALHEAGGYNVVATTELLPIFSASKDYQTMQEMIKAQIPQLEKVLITLLRQAVNEGEINTKPRWNKIRELAEPMFKTQVEKRGKLDTKFSIAYSDNLRLLDALKFYRYEKPSKNNRGGGIYKKFKFIEIDRLDVNAKGNITAVQWHFSQTLIDELPHLFFVNVDGFLEVTNPNEQMMATYINEAFVSSEARTFSTIKGDPIVRQADLLTSKAGLKNDRNVGRRYKLLKDYLDDLVKVGILKKWHTGNGDQIITSRDKESQTIYLFASENTATSYIPKKLASSLQEQELREFEARQEELRELQGLYRQDLKHNKFGKDYQDCLAEDLGITKDRLALLLHKPSKGEPLEEISDELLDKIREERSYYD